MNDIDFGAVVRNARTRQGITLKQLSEMTKIDISNISKFERGILDIQIKTLFKMLDVLGVKVEIGED